jgi:SAM-dependent methyltransferase
MQKVLVTLSIKLRYFEDIKKGEKRKEKDQKYLTKNDNNFKNKTPRRSINNTMLENIDSIREVLEHDSSKIKLDEISEYLHELTKQYENFDELLEDKNQATKEGRKLSTRFSNPNISLLRGTILAVQEGVNSQIYADAIIQNGRREKRSVDKNIKQEELSTTPLSLPGENNENHTWLEENKYKNWGRLLIPEGENFLGLESIDYDELHRRGMYLFSDTDDIATFARKVENYQNGPSGQMKIIDDKLVLTLGPGAGNDEEFFIANGARVVSLEGSEYMRNKIKEKFKGEGILSEDLETILDENNEQKWYLEEESPSFFEGMEKLAEQGAQFDTLYFHSAAHYFDEPTLKKFFKLAHTIIKPGGHIAGAFKAIDATLDGEGIQLMDKRVLNKTDDPRYMLEPEKKEQQETRRERGWFNPDGQTRFFRDPEVLHEIFEESGFKKRSRESRTVENYETYGVDQEFDYYIYKKEE